MPTKHLAPLKLFLDTEFTSLGINPGLISIGLISEDGAHQFYAELSDTSRKGSSDFVLKTVIPLLSGGDALMTMNELTLKLGAWIDDIEVPVVIVTDTVNWDWTWIQRIFRTEGTWPTNLAEVPFLLASFTVKDGERFDAAVALSYSNGLRPHHALDDAIANRKGWEASEACEQGLRTKLACKERFAII